MRLKAESIIGLIILIMIGLMAGIFFSVYESSYSNRLPSGKEVPKINNVTEPNESSNFTGLVIPGQNICEGCHLSGKRSIPQAYTLKQHVEGGAYCLTCHTIDHNIHPMNNNVTCEKCHGVPPQTPAYRDGSITCNNCHDSPDPLKPSNGNLIVIHRPRNVDCTRCHTDSCLKCHSEIKSNEKWDKRLGHFRALLRTVP